MGNESGTWIMHGVAWDDPACIHTVEQATKFINKVGFLPLFKNDIEGFSLEEHTVPELWWCEDEEKDPWEWREIIARRGEVAYGKFFGGRAGFISKEWLPHFANYRRDGYDFDSLWEDGKATARQHKIMSLFAGELADSEYFSFEMRQGAGFGKQGEKGFEGTVTALQMQLYLCIRDFRRRKNKKGGLYGWPIAVYSTPEHRWGYDLLSAAYGEDPAESAEKISAHISALYPAATQKQIADVIGTRAGERKEAQRGD